MVIAIDTKDLSQGRVLQISGLASCETLGGRSVRPGGEIALRQRSKSLICLLPILARRNKGNLNATT